MRRSAAPLQTTTAMLSLSLVFACGGCPQTSATAAGDDTVTAANTATSGVGDAAGATTNDATETGDTIEPVEVSATLQLPATGQTTSYSDGDDGDVQSGVAIDNATRFEDMGDGTIVDHKTGLMWLADASCLINNYPKWETDGFADGWVPWNDALAFIADINSGDASACGAGYTDWRLPNVNELESLVDAGQGELNAWLMSMGFTDVEANAYWTSTTNVDSPDTFAYVVDLSDGSVSKLGNKGSVITSVLPVRGVSVSDTPVWRTGQTTSYAAGDDGEHQAGVAWPSPRFTDNGDGTVTDHLTGLMWLKDWGAVVSKDWYEALAAAESFNAGLAAIQPEGYTASYSDWRIPNRKEFQSLFDYSQSSPAVAEGHPFANISTTGSYWSSTTYASDIKYGWLCDMRDGDISPELKVNGHLVVFVR
ncbi:MAG: DUF1566 domain-containing protein [Planctomycetota bacterium]|nr:MAG: DUF1566 domain-containing protein [Planctomycetota bacterium]